MPLVKEKAPLRPGGKFLSVSRAGGIFTGPTSECLLGRRHLWAVESKGVMQMMTPEKCRETPASSDWKEDMPWVNEEGRRSLRMCLKWRG